MIWLLLVLYQVKHFVCDYPLQGKWMLGKFKPYPEFVLPLTAHSAVHGVATFLIAMCVKPEIALWVALFDFKMHFTMDMIKAQPKFLGRFKPLTAQEYAAMAKQKAEAEEIFRNSPDHESVNHIASKEIIEACDRRFKGNTYFWWALGLDQGVHHLTHYAIIWGLLR